MTAITPLFGTLDLAIKAGETTAIVGPSGAGKSTIADLVMGLIVPGEGRILVDDRNLDPERIKAWRGQIGYVPQETFLFHDTLRANLLWARASGERGRDQGISETIGGRGIRVWSSLKAWIRSLETGVCSYPVGRDSAWHWPGRSSGSLPSSFWTRRPVPSIRRMRNGYRSAIEGLHGSMTILVISHRLSTIRTADMIYLIEEGRLIESGRWDLLIAGEGSRFRTLCEAQGIDIRGNGR